ncbi:hypothetical protein GCM10010470_63850 [Saccharopolyspora taberi]|uniref:DUF4352 domain-containing protein n=1 Tax=Saccharopolyspora taberi TaxID=60895 RepID=A0ABN3VNT1_9PSEU
MGCGSDPEGIGNELKTGSRSALSAFAGKLAAAPVKPPARSSGKVVFDVPADAGRLTLKYLPIGATEPLADWR